MERGSIPSLDGLRAVAIAFVVVSHLQLVYQSGTTRAVDIPLASLGRFQFGFAQGGFGVTIFFFLSGYLITTLLRLELERTGSIRLRDFYLRRVLRIFPPLYVVLVAGLAVTIVGPVAGWHLTTAGVLSEALYFNNYYQVAAYPTYGAPAGSWVFWSLAVEEHFYLLFPFAYLGLARLTTSRLRQGVALAAACALVLAWRLLLVTHYHPIEFRTFLATDTRIDSLLFGCILAIVENPALEPSRISESTWKTLLLPIGLIGIVVSWQMQGYRLHEGIVYTLQGLCLMPVFVGAVRYPTWWLFRPLNWPWVRFLGLISYVVYLVHGTVIVAVQQHMHPGLVADLVVVVIALVIGIVMRQLVEKPCARLRHRLSHAVLPTGAETRPAPA